MALSVLPDDLLIHVLAASGLEVAAASVAALRLTCRALRTRLDEAAALWEALTLLTGGSLSKPGARHSARIAQTPIERFASAYAALKTRSDYLHHAIARAGQDELNLTVGRARALRKHWAPCLGSRVSKVYNATILMEVCRARVSERTVFTVVREMLTAWGASPLVTKL